MSLIARNALWFSRGGGDDVPASLPNDPPAGEGLIQAIAGGAMRLVGAANITMHSTASNVTIGAYGAPNVVTVGSNSVIINGNVYIRGGIESLTTVELVVQDKVVRIARPLDNAPQLSDEELKGAGIVVDGGRGGDADEKSIRWMPPYANHPARWKVGGGGIHVERTFDQGARTVSYGLQVNDREELEIVRHDYTMTGEDGGGPQKRVFVIATSNDNNNMAQAPQHLFKDN